MGVPKWDTCWIDPDLLHHAGSSAFKSKTKNTEFQAVRKSTLAVFSLIILGVVAYFIMPMTPVPDYVDAVMNRANQLSGQ
ncbi:hypothetical protein LPB41_19845 [Thalassospira sp. MA62]|nr:hypothetical protein [Thalassospira sp. MA62]